MYVDTRIGCVQCFPGVEHFEQREGLGDPSVENS